MADTLDIVTLEEAYRAINDPASADAVSGGGSGGHDDQLARWITGVSRRVDDTCGPVVIRTITDEAHDGNRTSVWLRETPVDSVTSVSEYRHETETVLTGETNANRPSDAYLAELRGHYAKVYRRSGGSDALFPTGRGNVLVTYEAGRYADTGSVDEKFKAAVSGILRRLHSRDAGAWARGSDPFDVGSQAFFDAFKQSMKEFLADEVRQRRHGGIMVA